MGIFLFSFVFFGHLFMGILCLPFSKMTRFLKARKEQKQRNANGNTIEIKLEGDSYDINDVMPPPSAPQACTDSEK